MWEVITTELFVKWFKQQSPALKEDILAILKILTEEGPQLGRPFADTIKSSIHPNMKELRIQHQGNPVRAFYAFDPKRKGIILCAGDKTGLNEKLFYKHMIKIADNAFSIHLNSLKEGK
jgi:hypothetical protein